MNYVLFAVSLVVAFSYFLLAEKVFKLNNKFLKEQILAVILIVVFAVRYMCVEKSGIIDNLKGIDMLVSLGYTKLEAVLSIFGLWFSVTAFLICACRPFFNLKFLSNLVKYFVPISAIIILALGDKFLVLSGVFEENSLFGTILSVELGLWLAFSFKEWFLEISSGEIKNFKFDYKVVLKTLGILIVLLIATMPAYIPQYLHGYVVAALRPIDITPTHRVFIYLAIIMPMAMYFGLRNKSEENIRFFLIFISVGTMITFMADYSFERLSDLSNWPFHLCHTAMFIVPLALIFRMNRTFYFTYFINVFGALMAMLMPDYDATENIFSFRLIHFWVNHWVAFFFPILCVGLKQFSRPSFKNFVFSMCGFAVYFVFVLFLNAYFTAKGNPTDFFFINSTFIADKLGYWAEKLFTKTAIITINGLDLEFHPIYQILFFFTYVLLGLATWFVYELFFSISAEHQALHQRKQKIRLDRLYLEAQLNGRSIEEPMNINAGVKLELKNFSKRYDINDYYSVKNASFEVFGGEIFGFLGPNGAGKSTIIKSIVGIQPITEGSIEVCGFDCAKQSVMAKRQIGFVPDHYALYEKLSGREYINYIADIFDVSQEDRTERIEHYVKLFELEGSIDNPIKTYSHGMKQKITIMAALVHDPKLWILDEPLTGLDPNSIFQVKECMRQHAAKGNIVFFSSHIMEVVEGLCDRITIIKKGEIQCVRSVEEIKKEGSLEEFYLKTIGATDLIKKEG